MAIAMVPLAASFAYAAENAGWLALQGVAGATRSDCLSWKPISAGVLQLQQILVLQQMLPLLC
jgi:hypothetical protein